MTEKKKTPAKIKVVKVKSRKAAPKAKKAKAPRGRGQQKPNGAGHILVNYRVTPTEAREFRGKANRLTNGNVTQLVRRAVAAWKPTKKELQGIRKSTFV